MGAGSLLSGSAMSVRCGTRLILLCRPPTTGRVDPSSTALRSEFIGRSDTGKKQIPGLVLRRPNRRTASANGESYASRGKQAPEDGRNVFLGMDLDFVEEGCP